MKQKSTVMVCALAMLAGYALAQPNSHVSGPRYDTRSNEDELIRTLDCTQNQATYDECFWDAIEEYQTALPGADFSKITPPLIGLQSLTTPSGYYFEQPPQVWDLEEMRAFVIDYHATHDPYPPHRDPARPNRNPSGDVQRYINGLPSSWTMDGPKNDPVWGYRKNGVSMVFKCPTKINGVIVTDPYHPNMSLPLIQSPSIGAFNQNGSIIQFNYCRKVL